MIQDIKPYVYHNEYIPKEPRNDDYVMVYKKGSCFLKRTGETIKFLTVGEFRQCFQSELTYLFRIDDRYFYLAKEPVEDEFEGFAYEKLVELRSVNPKHLAFAGVTGYQLAMWYSNRRFCGHCGHVMEPDQKERMMFCPECGLQEFPKICPAVIVGIRDGDRLLLSKYEGRAFKRYALIAGFAEVGETIEETVQREAMEEVGLKVKNITYYKSQPWSFTDTLLMGFFCDLDGDDSITLDREELALAEWKYREEIPEDGAGGSLTREMMMVFKYGKDQYI